MTPREAATTIWRAALTAGAVGPLVERSLRLDNSRLVIGARTLELGRIRRVLVLGGGKAGGAMAQAVESILGEHVAEGLVVVKDGHTAPTKRITLAEAGHPVPDARGETASRRLLALAGQASDSDLVLVLISGGGSALTPAPAPPITLDEKQAVTRLLLDAGATIGELNAVRKHISVLKGGQLARAAAPAPVATLILSDVIGDPLDVIASGPTVPDPTTFADAVAVLERRGVWDRTPESIRRRLTAGRRGEVPETPKPGDLVFDRVENVVIGNNRLVLDAAATEARRLGFVTRILTAGLEGEARVRGRELAEQARTLPPPACLLAGGETTVTVQGTGRGGRCQEFALAAAQALAGDRGTTILAAGTDGTDGPTDAAGGLVDEGTIVRGRRSGLDPDIALANNDAWTFLSASGDLLVSGPTNTNLLDVYLALRTDARKMSEPV